MKIPFANYRIFLFFFILFLINPILFSQNLATIEQNGNIRDILNHSYKHLALVKQGKNNPLVIYSDAVTPVFIDFHILIYHWGDDYGSEGYALWVSAYVTDPQGLTDIDSVTITLPDNRAYPLYDDGQQHGDDVANDGNFYTQISFNQPPPTGVYTFTAKDKANHTVTGTDTLSIILDYPRNIRPTNNEVVSTPTPEFRWDPVQGANGYHVQVVDMYGQNLWNIYWKSNTDTSVIFNCDGTGMALEEGKFYSWLVGATSEDSYSEYSLVSFVFRTNNRRIIYVDSSNTSGIETGAPDYPFNTIQEGIDATLPGDTVLIYPGIYYENIDFTAEKIIIASLFLTSGDTSYISKTVIDGNQNGRVINAGGDNISITGLSIINGLCDFGGGGIRFGGDSLFLNHMIFENNSANTDGGAFYNCCGNQYTKIENSIFRNNISGAGAIQTGTCRKLDVINCKFIHNSATTGASALFGWQINVNLYNCLFFNNGSFPAININTCTGKIINCTFVNNDEGSLVTNQYIRIKNCIFWNNGLTDNTGWDVQYSMFDSDVTGTGNIRGIPHFNNIYKSDFRLQSKSLCIDGGTSDTSGLQLPSTDIMGNPRIYNSKIDIGSYESTIPLVKDNYLCENDTPYFLVVPGTDIKWYKEELSDTSFHFGDTLFIDYSTILSSNYYYVTQTLNNIESLPARISYYIQSSPDKPTIMLKGKTILICPDSGYYSYNWYFNNSPMDEEHKQFLEIQPSYQGYYHVEVVSENQCKTKSEAYTPPKDLAKATQTGENILIYPNPNHGVFNLIINNDKEGIMKISIRDFTGKEIKHIEFYKNPQVLYEEIDVNDIPKGLYLLNIVCNDKNVTIKIVIE